MRFGIADLQGAHVVCSARYRVGNIHLVGCAVGSLGGLIRGGIDDKITSGASVGGVGGKILPDYVRGFVANQGLVADNRCRNTVLKGKLGVFDTDGTDVSVYVACNDAEVCIVYGVGYLNVFQIKI